MSANETMGDKRPENKPGVYRTDEGHEIITTSDPNFGRIQADAIIQQGYKWVGPVPSKKTDKVETPKK